MRALWIGLALAGCAGARHLDPPPIPAAIVPAVAMPSTAPPPYVARVVFDVVDGPATIQFKTIQSIGAVWLPVCTTPCVADVPIGIQNVSFQLRSDPSRGDSDQVLFVPGTSVYRRALGGHDSNAGLLVGGYFVAYTGVSTLMMSLLMLSLGGGTSGARDVALI